MAFDPGSILVTRARPGAEETAARLEEMGLRPVISPVIELALTDATLPDLSAFEGLVFTSANGVRFLSRMTETRDLPVWCVGPATASEALRAGFSPVHQSSGYGEDLAEYIAHHWSEGRPRTLLHIANSATKGVIKSNLDAAGFDVTFVPLYQAYLAPELNADAAALLTSNKHLICLIHSAMGAQSLLELASGHSLSHVSFVVISQQAAAPLSTAGCKSITIASHPDEAHMMDALKGVLAAG